MVAARVKFRCFHCNRLLSASVSRIGRAVACPKCVQVVIVPTVGEGAELDPDPESSSVATRAARAPSSPAGADRKSGEELPAFMSEIAASIPDDVLAIQPEDIRAEIPSIEIDVSPSQRIESTVEAEGERRAADSAPAVPWLPEAEAETRDTEAAETLPPSIQIETGTVSSILPSTPSRRSGDVTLPASVVLAWSLFVLFAQALAFIAGLLIGHFYWKQV